MMTATKYSFGVFSLNNSLATLPEYATEHSACFDLTFCPPSDKNTADCYYARNNKATAHIIGNQLTIFAGMRVLVPTALIFDLQSVAEPTFWNERMGKFVASPSDNFSMKVYPRSGLSFKTGLGLINSVGIIDGDYTDQLMIPMINHSEKDVVLTVGDRIAQAEILNNGVSVRSSFVWRASKPEKVGGRTGGFGSTGGFTTAPITTNTNS